MSTPFPENLILAQPRPVCTNSPLEPIRFVRTASSSTVEQRLPAKTNLRSSRREGLPPPASHTTGRTVPYHGGS